MRDREILNFYIDDTGTKDPIDLNTPIFAYAGIVVRKTNEKYIIDRINEIKQKYFKKNIELKSRWFRIPDERKKYYLDPCNIDSLYFKEFTTELFEIIQNIPIRCLGAIVDKNKLKKTYRVAVFSPSSVCYELLLQRIANFCTQHNGKLINIYIDDMSGKTEKGNEWKELLKIQHKKLLKGKSALYRTWNNRTCMDYSKINNEIEFLDSENNILIQLADLCAYSVMRQGKENWNNFDDPPFYTGFKWIKKIMHCDPITGKITQYGALCFPK